MNIWGKLFLTSGAILVIGFVVDILLDVRCDSGHASFFTPDWVWKIGKIIILSGIVLGVMSFLFLIW